VDRYLCQPTHTALADAAHFARHRQGRLMSRIIASAWIKKRRRRAEYDSFGAAA